MSTRLHVPFIATLLAGCVLTIGAPGYAALCATPGQDGGTSGAPISLSGIINTYYPGTSSVAAGATSIQVGSPSGTSTPIASGNLLLVIQMQDASIDPSNSSTYGDGVASDPANGWTSLNGAGTYEYVVAQGPVSGGWVPIRGKGANGGLLFAYTNAAFGTQGQRRFQVIRVPQYNYARVSTTPPTALAWNGSVGGVLALDVAYRLDIPTDASRTMTVTGLGFRGGGGRFLSGASGSGLLNTDYRSLASLNANGSKGEGIAGTPRWVRTSDTAAASDTGAEGYPQGSHARGAPGTAGGGGTDGNPAGANDRNTGGGGGGNGGSGGKGGNAWSAPAEVTGGHGGAAFPVGTYAGARVVMGGGGGSAPANNNNSNDYPHGAAGGGIILIRARQITIPSNSSLTLSANGGTAPRSTQDGGGGGGAGGTVLCATCTVGALTRLTASATGGAGADTLWPTGNGTPDMHGPGGGGGGGVVLLSGAPASTTVTGGAAGHARSGNADGGVYGATAGSAGVSSTSTDVLASPGADPGCGCVPTAVVVSSFEALAASRGAVVEWETASEAGTAGFVLERQDGSAGWREVHTGLLPALPEVAQGGTYRLVDETAPAASDSPLVYRLTEVERSGRTLEYGPFEVAVDWSHAAVETTESFSSRSHPLVAAPAIERIATEGRIRKPQALKLGVREAGIYELSAAAIASGLGETLESVRSMIRTGQVRITNLGTPIAWEAGEAAHGVRFFGVPPESVYTAENIYWLWPRQAGTVMESFDGGSPEPASQDQTYTDTLHVEKNLFAGLTTALSTEADYWYWEMVASGDPKLGSKTVTFDVPGVASSRSAATLVVNLYGASETGVEGEHGAAVSLNGQPLGTARWQGIGAYRMKLAIPAGALHRGLNSLTVTGVKGNGVPFDYFYLNSLDLTYRRLYDGGGAPLTVVGDGNRVITVRGFSDSQLLGYDITAPAGPRVLTRGTITADGTAYSLSFVPASVARRYLVLSTSAVRAPRIEPWNPPIQPLGAPGRLPSHLIIAPRVLADAAEELALYHRSQGLDARLIEAEQIYDELTFGLVTPRAIEALLSRVDAGSARRPRSVVLVGSGTYDYKDYLGLGGNLLPPLMIRTEAGLVAADSELVLGTDTVIGRVPAQSPTEVEGYLRKLAAYESARPGEWQEAVTILADNPDKGGDFDVDADRLAALVPPPYSAQKLYLGPLPLPSLRRDLLAGLAEGRFLVAFVGHAGVDRLAAEGILTSADVPALAATDALPVVTAFSCHVGRFDLAGFRCLGDHLVTNDGRGAVAVFAPAGLNYNTQSLGLGEAVFNAVFAASSRRRDVRLAEILREAIASHAAAGGSTTTSRGYNLLGDPAVRLKRGE